MTMHAIPDNRVVSHAARTLAPAMSAADKAAHFEATGPIRGNTAICPNCQRPVISSAHQCGLTDTGLKALTRLEHAVAPILRDRQTADAARNDIAARDNWVPNVAPVEWDAEDVILDAYSTRVLPLTLAAA